jgi:hypothetical protein
MSKWCPFLRFTNAKNPLPWVIYAMGTDRCTLGDGNLQVRPPRIAKGRIATFKAYPKGFPAPLAGFGGVFGQLLGGQGFPLYFSLLAKCYTVCSNATRVVAPHARRQDITRRSGPSVAFFTATLSSRCASDSAQ